jgi:outer membrane protein assembly factor BamB
MTRFATAVSTALLVAMIGAAAFFIFRVNAPSTSNPTPANLAAVSPSGTPEPTATLPAATPETINDAAKLPPGVDWALRLPQGESVDFGGMTYANGTVYRLLATSSFVGVEAVNSQRGTLEWKVAKEWSGQGIVAGEAGVYFTGTLNQIVAIDPGSGADLWQVAFNRPVVSMALSDDTLYVWDQSSTMTALDANTGATVWQTAAPTSTSDATPSAAANAPLSAPAPIAGEDFVAMIGADGTLHAFHRTSGGLLWSVPGFDGSSARLAIDQQTLFVLSGDRQLTGTGIDFTTGKVKWTIGISGVLRQPVATNEHFFYLIGDEITSTSDIAPAGTALADYSECCAYWPGSKAAGFVSTDGESHVFGIDSNSGGVIWSRSTKAGGFTALITIFPQSGGLSAITADGHVIQLQRETGGILRDPLQLGGDVASAISGGSTEAGNFATLTDGSLVAFGGVPRSEQG